MLRSYAPFSFHWYARKSLTRDRDYAVKCVIFKLSVAKRKLCPLSSQNGYTLLPSGTDGVRYRDDTGMTKRRCSCSVWELGPIGEQGVFPDKKGEMDRRTIEGRHVN